MDKERFVNDVKSAIMDNIITMGYNDRMAKVAKDGLDDYAGINTMEAINNGVQPDGTISKQASDEIIICEARRQIVEYGYKSEQQKLGV